MTKKLLIYNSGGGIGDSIQLFPLILSLENLFDKSEIYYLGAHDNHFSGKLKEYNIKVKTYILKEKNEPAGFFEQITDTKNNEIEIAYFGILKDFYGKKYGGYLLSEAIKLSLNKIIKRVWVHTCSLDHKNALNNYISRGMKIFKTETVLL